MGRVVHAMGHWCQRGTCTCNIILDSEEMYGVWMVYESLFVLLCNARMQKCLKNKINMKKLVASYINFPREHNPLILSN